MESTAISQGQLSLAHFILDVVAQIRHLCGSEASDPDLALLSIKEIDLSIPYAPTRVLPNQSLDLPIMRLSQAESYLSKIDQKISVERARLVKLPQERIARLELRIRFLD